MKRERRQPTAAEWASITSRSPVVHFVERPRRVTPATKKKPKPGQIRLTLGRPNEMAGYD